ncbi:MAG: glycosyltransferase family 2 protein [Dethiobacter sp.]|nr:glycosyltransferase family 2 protein [Dethiobacter sp.]
MEKFFSGLLKLKTMLNKIAAIVVTYCPDEFMLKRLLSGLVLAKCEVIVVDNTPVGANYWLSNQWIAEHYDSIQYHPLGDNLGIAKAQNIGIEIAEKQFCEHVIFFDQDSAISTNLIVNLLNVEQDLLNSGVKVGSIGPLFLDEKSNEYSPAIRHKGPFVTKVKIDPKSNQPVEADCLISSGSLIRIDVLRNVGLMRESLFIDWVDIEWGLRAKNHGYQHYIAPSAIMLHSIGDRFVTIGVKKINIHSDLRNYYIVRNACHLLLDRNVLWQWRLSIVFKIPKYLIFYTFSTESPRKFKVFQNLVRACLDGFSGKLDKAG